MNIGIYNPFLHSLSGGERYTMILASYWSKRHAVTIFWDDAMILTQVEKRFGLDCSRIKVSPNLFHAPLLIKMRETSKFDVLFVLSDGSIPVSLAKHNILHFQVPFSHIFFPFWKQLMYKTIVYNSQFTKNHIDRNIREYGIVMYPPVDTSSYILTKKEKLIVSIGRFTSYHHAKKQELLIRAFIDGEKKGILKGWRLVLAGGLLDSDKDYFKQLTSMIDQHPAISLLPNCTHEMIKDLYGKACFYWHAAGFGETDPQRMEHFGIATVEAMAAGCIPIVYNAGGQPEIIDHGKNGFLWNTLEECLHVTNSVICSQKLQEQLRRQGKVRAMAFSTSRFCQRFDEILHQK